DRSQGRPSAQQTAEGTVSVSPATVSKAAPKAVAEQTVGQSHDGSDGIRTPKNLSATSRADATSGSVRTSPSAPAPAAGSTIGKGGASTGQSTPASTAAQVMAPSPNAAASPPISASATPNSGSVTASTPGSVVASTSSASQAVPTGS